ncbi:MAG: recombinase family protein, partial [Planctomycetota bacterium]
MTPETPTSRPRNSKPLRCAIYTRKSHEEGLDQAFNSLDAQREAGVDYIHSQKHEGWEVSATRYDDGGYTGGNIKRPALARLLSDIEQGTSGGIDVVVVYKVDRLSRSLSDFAGMMKLFEQHNVSFVSVTQQFNTTNSMGRLTLNMLLSFAQFEREVTGERIRDKIAATKKKGLWVGGRPPLGYRLEDRRLHIVPPEAELVQEIFRGYLDTDGSLLELADRLNRQG